MSQFKSKEFRNLQKDWYKKLANTGFEDIEDTSSQNEFLKSWSSEINETGQEYYYMAEHFLSEYSFQDDDEKLIWEMHTNGKSERDIAIAFKRRRKRGLKKSNIHCIIDRLRKMMLYRFSND